MHRYRASRLWPAKRVKSQVWTSERNALQAHALSFAGIRGPSLTVYCMTFAGRRVLLVEDEFLAGLTTIGVLEGFGCEVVGPVARLAMALRLAKFETLDAAVLDINVAGEADLAGRRRIAPSWRALPDSFSLPSVAIDRRTFSKMDTSLQP
jgi:hypothetical protein